MIIVLKYLSDASPLNDYYIAINVKDSTMGSCCHCTEGTPDHALNRLLIAPTYSNNLIANITTPENLTNYVEAYTNLPVYDYVKLNYPELFL
jgi:hypothetical protein